MQETKLQDIFEVGFGLVYTHLLDDLLGFPEAVEVLDQHEGVADCLQARQVPALLEVVPETEEGVAQGSQVGDAGSLGHILGSRDPLDDLPLELGLFGVLWHFVDEKVKGLLHEFLIFPQR